MSQVGYYQDSCTDGPERYLRSWTYYCTTVFIKEREDGVVVRKERLGRPGRSFGRWSQRRTQKENRR